MAHSYESYNLAQMAAKWSDKYCRWRHFQNGYSIWTCVPHLKIGGRNSSCTPFAMCISVIVILFAEDCRYRDKKSLEFVANRYKLDRRRLISFEQGWRLRLVSLKRSVNGILKPTIVIGNWGDLVRSGAFRNDST